MALRSDDRREDGQGLVEFALILPIFLIVLFGLVDVGRAVYSNSVLSQAAREGARLASTEAGWVGASGGACVGSEAEIDSGRPGGHICPVTTADLRTNVVDAVDRMVIAVGPLSGIHISCNKGDANDPAPTGEWTEAAGGNGCADGTGVPLGAAGEVVSVRVQHEFQPITPIIGSILGTPTLSASASMVIN